MFPFFPGRGRSPPASPWAKWTSGDLDGGVGSGSSEVPSVTATSLKRKKRQEMDPRTANC